MRTNVIFLITKFFESSIKASFVTSPRTWQLPDKDGTFALEEETTALQQSVQQNFSSLDAKFLPTTEKQVTEYWEHFLSYPTQIFQDLSQPRYFGGNFNFEVSANGASGKIKNIPAESNSPGIIRFDTEGKSFARASMFTNFSSFYVGTTDLELEFKFRLPNVLADPVSKYSIFLGFSNSLILEGFYTGIYIRDGNFFSAFSDNSDIFDPKINEEVIFALDNNWHIGNIHLDINSLQAFVSIDGIAVNYDISPLLNKQIGLLFTARNMPRSDSQAQFDLDYVKLRMDFN